MKQLVLTDHEILELAESSEVKTDFHIVIHHYGIISHDTLNIPLMIFSSNFL